MIGCLDGFLIIFDIVYLAYIAVEDEDFTP